jgi:hypothetical protein
MIVVADSGPPHCLTLLEQVDLLRRLDGRVLVLQAASGRFPQRSERDD